MSTPFDDIRELAFASILERMGTEASWISSVEGYEKKALVLFREPTDDRMIAQFGYNPNVWYVEWKGSDFEGLDDAVDAGNDELITIDGVDYWVRHVHRKFDGFNYLSTLEKVKS